MRVIRCARCHQTGHQKNNRNCPMLQEGLNPSTVIPTAPPAPPVSRLTQALPASVSEPVEEFTDSESETDYSSSEVGEGEQVDFDEDELEFEEPTPMEVQVMREQLSRLSAKHPNVLTDPIDTYHDDLISKMSAEELRARLKMVRRACNSQMNTMITKNIIRLANNGVGLVSGKGSENLNNTTLNDPMLIDSANEYISENVLDLLADEIKLGIIYSSHVANDILTPAKNNVANQ